MDRGHLLSRTGSAAGEGSAAPSIASTPRHSTVHRLEGAAPRSDPPSSEVRLPEATGGSERALPLPPASEQPDLRAYVDLKLADVNRILNGGARMALRCCVDDFARFATGQRAWGRLLLPTRVPSFGVGDVPRSVLLGCCDFSAGIERVLYLAC